MWSTSYADPLSITSSKTSISSDFTTQLSSSGTLDFGNRSSLNYEPNTFRPGQFDLTNALENEFNLGLSTTDHPGPSAHQRNQETPLGNSKVTSQLPSTFSAPEYGLDSVEGSYLLQGLRPKQGTHTFSSRFQQLLDRKLQAEAAAKSQQRLAASQQSHSEAERACATQFPSSHAINAHLQSTTNNFFVSADQQTHHQFTSSFLGQMTQAMASTNYPMHSNMRDVQDGKSQSDSRNGHPSSGSRYPVIPSSDSYASSSVVPPHLGPPAVQPSYQPAPIRSQHYQRLLAAKLANSGQSDADASSSVANDGAASFMQHWADHTLDPNYPTPQEMSFLPSSHSPLYQLFNSGYAQDQWQPTAPYPDTSVRNGASNGNLVDHTAAEAHYGTHATQQPHREMWPVNQLERIDAPPVASPVPPYYPATETNAKYNTWLNPYPQPVEDSDTASTQSSRAPGQMATQQPENVSASGPKAVLSTPPTAKDLVTPVKNTKESGPESTASPQRNDGNLSLKEGADEAEEDEPKKAMLACHFCRGRKLKCDGTRPTCAHCDKRGLTCSYDAQIRRRGPGKRKREQMAMLAVAEGKMDEDGTPLLHKLLAPKPKGKRGRKPKNRNPEGEASSSVQNLIDQAADPTGGNESEETTYARPPNPYLPSYFIPDQNPEYPLLGPESMQPPPPAHYLSHPSQPGNMHVEVKREHQPTYQPPPPPPKHPHSYHPGYPTSAQWPEDMDSAHKRQRTEHYLMSGRW